MADNNKLNDPSRSPHGGHPQPGPERMHTDLQADPEMAEGPASKGRIVAFGAAIVVVLGIVFYGLNNTAQTPETNSTATQSTPASPATATAPTSGNKDQSAPNAAPGTTTGAAPAPAPTPAAK